ncbi:dolichyl-diphosphooligosaccharide-protein glycotransferase [Artomyces pyxidatus]|uniref:Dolichyl-diphosphooligosaccharide-protein glycotransferase n=1 Tax=Artomyces pyxidatus TaxID=48021 RepID=A0ACB8T1D4_9AGAM|nr:dolichyl-diphosphooligosaccharide-protein glycotransferase [Artomyces pyxidatus]
MLLSFLALLALPACIFAAQQSTHDRLVKLAAQNGGVIKLDAHTFDLLTSPQRDWSASIQFTAMDKRRKCNPCKQFDPSWVSVAKAWSTAPKDHRDQHFFATLDFDDGTTVFQKLGMQSAPVVLNYPPAQGSRKSARASEPVSYDFSSGFDAEPLAEQLSQFTPVPIPYRAPVDFVFWGTTGTLGLISVLAIRFLAPIFRSKWTWAALTVSVSLVMTSGYMFTRIRNSPMTAADGQWIAPGFQNQYGQETTVVASISSFIDGLLSASFLMLTLVAPHQRSPSRQRTQIYLWSGVIMILFSVLVSFFRVKNRGYPFKLIL